MRVFNSSSFTSKAITTEIEELIPVKNASNASACATVRGKPSKINPFASGFFFTSSSNIAIVTESGTKFPSAII
ncbi:hypothetical protein D3C72_2403280 [compost metagenome]